MKGTRPDGTNASDLKTPERFERYLNAAGTENAARIKSSLRSVMTANMSVFRTQTGIQETLESIQAFQIRSDKAALTGQALPMNPELIQRWELDNLLLIARVIAAAALDRRESRGAHYRDDYPERKDRFNHHTLVSMSDAGTVRIGKRAVDMSIFEAGGHNAEKFGMIQRKY